MPKKGTRIMETPEHVGKKKGFVRAFLVLQYF